MSFTVHLIGISFGIRKVIVLDTYSVRFPGHYLGHFLSVSVLVLNKSDTDTSAESGKHRFLKFQKSLSVQISFWRLNLAQRDSLNGTKTKLEIHVH